MLLSQAYTSGGDKITDLPRKKESILKEQK